MSLVKALFLAPLSVVFGFMASIRRVLFDLGIFKEHNLSVPIISVGNLTVGGTGKTPTVRYLLNLCEKQKKNVAIVSRGYGGKVTEPTILPDSDDYVLLSSCYGDEASMYRQLTDAVVAVGADRVAVVEKVLEVEKKIDLIIADDAFQHRRLARDLDIVLLDATRPLSDYKYLPWGRARESFKSLKRADIVFLSKSNLVAEENLVRLKHEISKYISVTTPVLSLKFQVNRLDPLFGGGESLEISHLQGKKVVLLSGLGNAKAFEKSVVDASEAELLRHFEFPDHHAYSLSDLDSVVQFCRDNQVLDVIMSEKDAVKVSDFEQQGVQFWFSRLEVSMETLESCNMVERMIGDLF